MVASENSHHGTSQPHKGLHSPYDRTIANDSNLIRLLLLQPSSCYESDIHGKLEIFKLTELCEQVKDFQTDEFFEVLSYTWGTEQSSNKLTIDGIAMPMKTNLETFLRRRREADRAVRIWIDALCINQDDTEEKNQLVPRMSIIYMLSNKLRIWLGPADADSDLAMENLHELSCGSPYDPVPLLSRDIIEAFQHLFSRPWWSRVWIIQEVAMGGAAAKLRLVTVMCGEKEIKWADLVVAAARLWSHHTERRQYFPNIRAILNLDRLRNDSAEPLMSYARSLTEPEVKDPLVPAWAISLVSEYRHFQATDARDKVYALANMFSIYPQRSITPDYTAAPTSVYTDFASWALQHGNGLELLRHCGTRALNVPSWVPDWSVSQNCLPLPSKNRNQLRSVPWWSEPYVETCDDVSKGPEGKKKRTVQFLPNNPLADPEHKHARRRLKIGSMGSGWIKSLDEIPRNFECFKTFNNIPSIERNLINEVLGSNAAGFMVRNGKDFDSIHVKEEDMSIPYEQAIQREIHHQLFSHMDLPPYQAAGTTDPNFRMDQQKLMVEGVVWDEIESVHCGFVPNVDANFEDTTRFMVALGQCKAMAEDSLCASRRLPDLKERLRSFWLCILAGQPGTSDLDPSIFEKCEIGFEEGPVVEYMSWLPPIPSTWNPGTPPVTVTTYGFLDLAERAKRSKTVLDLLAESEKGAKKTFTVAYLSGLIPSDWTPAERETYQEKFTELGMLWSEQRYDLYHTPFEFLNVIPDPYWDTRKDHDELAREKTLVYFSDMETYIVPLNGTRVEGSLADDNNPLSKVYREEMARLWNSQTTRVSRGTLRSGYEKYALGRKFFITKKGYFGLTSKEAKVGDRVAVLLGSDVPFVLRACGRVEGKRNWQMIGEAYVDGIMDGEVLNQVDLGNVQTSMIHIS